MRLYNSCYSSLAESLNPWPDKQCWGEVTVSFYPKLTWRIMLCQLRSHAKVHGDYPDWVGDLCFRRFECIMLFIEVSTCLSQSYCDINCEKCLWELWMDKKSNYVIFRKGQAVSKFCLSFCPLFFWIYQKFFPLSYLSILCKFT